MNSVRYMHDLLDFNAPFNMQESWDNCGLNVGSMEQIFENIYVALELDSDNAKKLLPNSLVITHHPLFFKPLKNFDYCAYPCNIAKILIEKNCSLIAMHTNFDKCHLNEFFTQQILNFSHFEQEGIFFHGVLERQDFHNLALNIKATLNLPTLRVCQATQNVEYAFVICGAGFSEIANIARFCAQNNIKNAALISGDLKYHDAMIAKSMDLNLIDVPHFESEKYFTQIMAHILQNASYKAIIADFKNPIAHI